MCGICGKLNFKNNKPIQPQLIEDMKQMIRHRGPDGEGTFIDGSIGLGHRRLSIIDLTEAGKQPLCNEDSTIWITYNGEIYNYKEFIPGLISKGHKFKSSTDTEVIIHLYEEKGLDFISHLDGMFAFALWDAVKKRLVLVRDRIGIKPLYYMIDQDGISFASEIKALLKIPGFNKEINFNAFYLYFQTLTVPAPHSIFKNVNKLEPGHMLIIENKEVMKRKYWDIEPSDFSEQKSEAQIMDELENHLLRVTKSHLMSDVPLGAFLSGGVDSSSVVALASIQKKDPLETFSVTFLDEVDNDESRYARRVSEQYKTNHNEYDMNFDFIKCIDKIAWHADEPFAVSSAFALYNICQIASKKVKVALSGDGADELFAGYPRHFTLGKNYLGRIKSNHSAYKRLFEYYVFLRGRRSLTNKMGRTLLKAMEKLLTVISPSSIYGFRRSCYTDIFTIAKIFNQDFFEDKMMHYENLENSIFCKFFNDFQEADPVNKRLYPEIKTSLADEMLAKVDRMSMAFGLEARVPFLDHHLVEFALKIPGHYKKDRHGGKLILKKLMQKYLPREILYRKKHGFNVPLGKWFLTDLSDYVKDGLSEIKRDSIFNAKVVDNLMNEHMRGKNDHSTILFQLLAWENWQRNVLRGA